MMTMTDGGHRSCKRFSNEQNARDTRCKKRDMARTTKRRVFCWYGEIMVTISIVLVLTPAIAQDEEPPLLVFTEDMCEIEITPAELEMLIDTPLDFYTIYAEMMRCEPPPGEQYACKGCNEKNRVINECFHRTMDSRSEPCRSDECI